MNSRMHLNLVAPPRNPTQVPPGVEDTIGKHDEGEFNNDPDAVDEDMSSDEDEGLEFEEENDDDENDD